MSNFWAEVRGVYQTCCAYGVEYKLNKRGGEGLYVQGFRGGLIQKNGT